MKYRSRKRAWKIRFRKFSDMAKYILTNLSDAEYRLLKSIVGTLLVLPFCTADCERAFSAMNRIETLERSRLKDILKSLIIAYTATYEEKANLDITELSKKVATSFWKKKAKRAIMKMISLFELIPSFFHILHSVKSLSNFLIGSTSHQNKFFS